MEKSKRTLDDEIQDLLEVLTDSNVDDEEYAHAVKHLDTLYKLKLEEDKTKSELSNGKVQNKFRIVGYVIEGLGIVVPLIFYGKWMKRGFKFEETGTYTSKTFMGLQRFFKPTRK